MALVVLRVGPKPRTFARAFIATGGQHDRPGAFSSTLELRVQPLHGSGGPDGIESELPAFEIFDADCNKVFDTNEDTPCELQEANARMASSAPRLLASLVTCANLLADFEESDGEEGDAYREAVAAITEATGRTA